MLAPPFRLPTVTADRSWRRYDPARQDHMRAQLERILATEGLSRDVYEIASKSLK